MEIALFKTHGNCFGVLFFLKREEKIDVEGMGKKYDRKERRK
jgi:hypothetical protein